MLKKSSLVIQERNFSKIKTELHFLISSFLFCFNHFSSSPFFSSLGYILFSSNHNFTLNKPRKFVFIYRNVDESNRIKCFVLFARVCKKSENSIFLLSIFLNFIVLVAVEIWQVKSLAIYLMSVKTRISAFKTI